MTQRTFLFLAVRVGARSRRLAQSLSQLWAVVHCSGYSWALGLRLGGCIGRGSLAHSHLCMRGVVQHIGRHFASRPRASSSLFCLWGDVSESGREGGEEPSLHRAWLLHWAGS